MKKLIIGLLCAGGIIAVAICVYAFGLVFTLHH